MNSQVELKEFLPEAKTGIYKPKKHITYLVFFVPEKKYGSKIYQDLLNYPIYFETINLI
jgi:phosphate starvation-inducible membrane PsiE